ncbi:MBOAT family protein [Magnetospira sp. QH-2]|uniref:MBOAT family O-acyltransferase n=1 Tax=Magnetospira sp. (strain QH-2) TaxID=1288970 RepID=UPI0003E81579|nr:MBOAT family protein [Magnetospira sp. QH-2]CCQ75478.1 putative alginate O-acetyltransferase [Magnetospira sp. QH-2]
MLFSSQTFLVVFLPALVLGTILLGRLGSRKLVAWYLLLASLIFYGWWEPRYLLLIAVSIYVNFAIGKKLHAKPSKLFVGAGIVFNLAILGYFKYANFFLDNINFLAGTHWDAGTIILPLAISFFTFQQIAYLVDVYQGKAEDHDLGQYALFVTFFPQLIAGPIVHHKEMMPQFNKPEVFHLTGENLKIGLLIFSIGLYKKIVIADGISVYSDAVFAADTVSPTFLEAWAAALSYTFQIYFDFSGYSDMAVGLARIFGIRLPMNFCSPYRASSIILFWRHWHMTLSRFLRDYLYFPLGGNRHGTARRYANLITVMLLGGLWHGAGWTFIAWGALHGLYLVVNHAWNALGRTMQWTSGGWIGRWAGRVLTFVAVVVAWVFFRADDFSDAGTILLAMSGMGDAAPTQSMVNGAAWFWIAILLGVVWILPNTHEWFAGHNPTVEPEYGAPDSLLRHRWIWEGWSGALWRHRMLFFAPFAAILGSVGLAVAIYRGSEIVSFIYMAF